MTFFSDIFPYLLVAPSLVYSLMTLWAAAGYFRRQKCAAADMLPVTILKPVKGMDSESFDNFASFCRQKYDRFQIVFAVASADDEAVPVIRRLMAEFPEVDVELVVDGRIYGPNYKVCNLMNAFPKAKYDIIIVCDSDIRVGDRYLAEVCSAFADPAVGLVTSLYRTSGVQGWPSAVEALGFTVEMVPNVMMAMRLEGLTFALGASMAVRRDVLEQIGGFAVLVDYLADDYQLGNRVFLSGYRLELSDYFVESVMKRETLATVFSRQLRWCRTMRVSRPGGYFASGITQPAVASVAALISGGWPSGVAAVIMLYAVRSLSGLIFSRRFISDRLLPRYLWLLPFRDLLASVTWGLAFLGNMVVWRGHSYRVLPGGRMKEVQGG
ncbi:ceramide glucosyltransferase [Geobacter sp. OR-1]|uniref:bacteriohopanetetrol glucosamine biosynthesis glycosyltransferase HpnI n=1 Tax=Geobacter sp. OR-1 TaxID=1266765 RepID=UPI0005437176|nr:bacteriohopanetetrol glucosamine biosynthesis glycosyltransferase HpnI [Geobacter sp. OR-1]GAM08904.1 ceramide glucosyltransferase [Geobacter sp. OR-1]